MGHGDAQRAIVQKFCFSVVKRRQAPLCCSEHKGKEWAAELVMGVGLWGQVSGGNVAHGTWIELQEDEGQDLRLGQK